jgi:hypothetical protein
VVSGNTTGVRIEGSGTTVRRSELVRNGQENLSLMGTVATLVEDNEIAHADAGDNPSWVGRGIMLTGTSGVVLRGNHIHHNTGHGVWTKVDNIDTRYEGNLIEDNQQAGINHDRSYAATISGNTIRRNGLADGDFIPRAAVYVKSSPDVEVVDNVITGNGNAVQFHDAVPGALGAYGRLDPVRAVVTGNVVEDSGLFGLWSSRAAPYDTALFESNTYRYDDPGEALFGWNAITMDWAAWQAWGNDSNGVFETP